MSVHKLVAVVNVGTEELKQNFDQEMKDAGWW